MAAVASCFVVTFYAIAELSKLDFLGLELSVDGKLGKREGKLGFTGIVVKPTLTIFRDQDRECANRLLEKTEQGCLIARSLACPVTMEPLVEIPEEVPVCSMEQGFVEGERRTGHEQMEQLPSGGQRSDGREDTAAIDRG